MGFLNKLLQVNTINWSSFFNQECKDTIAKYSSFSTPSLDHISWRHLKTLISSNTCLKKIVCIANTCIDLEY